MSKDQSSLASSKRVLPLFGWLFCGVIALVLVFCFLPKPGNSNLTRDTVPVVRGSTSLEVTATGTVTPISEIKISP
jgi:hypothetical protein